MGKPYQIVDGNHVWQSNKPSMLEIDSDVPYCINARRMPDAKLYPEALGDHFAQVLDHLEQNKAHTSA
jgi:hypothetical protein